MTEPKRRGRPPKAKPCDECGQTDGHYDDCSAGITGTNPAQAYALRVWHGQSESAGREWRIERVKQALEGQGMSMDGVTLP